MLYFFTVRSPVKLVIRKVRPYYQPHGGDLASTWVTKPLEHAEVQSSS